jgi:hypothetical protein
MCSTPTARCPQILKTKRVFVLKEEVGTLPRFFYYFDERYPNSLDPEALAIAAPRSEGDAYGASPASPAPGSRSRGPTPSNGGGARSWREEYLTFLSALLPPELSSATLAITRGCSCSRRSRWWDVNAYCKQLRARLATTGMTDQVSWGFYIANFTFLVGMAAAAAMLVIPVYIYRNRELHDLVIFGELFAVAAIIMAMLFVVVDLGRPDRFHHMLLRFNFPVSMLDMGCDLVAQRLSRC